MGDAGSQTPAAEKSLADVRQRLQERVDEQDRLTLRAPIAGAVVPPSRRSSPTGPGELDSWSGDPLDPVNQGAYLTGGTLFCLVGDRQALEALLVIDQSEVELVAIGQAVRVQVDQLPGRYLNGQISEMSQVDLESAPPELSVSGMLPIRTGDGGRDQLVGIFYQAKVSLADHPPELLPGATGRARVRVAHRSIGRRILRYMSDTFQFRL
jgi:putative peptide zinc metalloprotease protein